MSAGSAVHSDIPSLLRAGAGARGEAPAIITPGGEAISYVRLQQEAARLAAQLATLAPRAGARPRIGIVLPNGASMAVALLGVASAGTALPFNPAHRRDEYRDYFRATSLDAVLVAESAGNEAGEAAQELGLRLVRLQADRTLAEPADPAEAPSPAPDDVALVLLTSGSTGRPKAVPLTHRNLCASAADVCASMSLGPEDRCLALWEQHHIGGLVDLLLAPLASGGSVVCGGGFEARNCLDLLGSSGATWYQCVPATLHELVVRCRPPHLPPATPRLRLIRSVAAALPPKLMEEAESLFGVPVLQTFGMTEAGPLITSTRLPPAPRRPGSVGAPCGNELRIVGPAGETLPPDVVGEVAIRGANVFGGYENDPEANAAQFRDGWFHTGDLGKLDDRGELHLVGRIKQLINRGGEKVNPQEVDDALLTCPGVEEAACFPVPHPTLGEDVAAAYVAKAPIPAETLRAHLSTRLSAFKIPGRFEHVKTLPRTPVGKIDRNALSQGSAQASRPAGKRPTGPTETAIAHAWARTLGQPVDDAEADFRELGGDSLSAVRAMLEVEQALGRRFPAAAQGSFLSVRQLAKLCEEGRGLERTSAGSHLKEAELRTIEGVMRMSRLPAANTIGTLAALHPEGSLPPLFWCFNNVATDPATLAGRLGADRPLLAGFSGGATLGIEESLLDRIAGHYAAQLQEIRPKDGFLLGGNCKGAWIALRVARKLIEAGRVVDRLCLMEHADLTLADTDVRHLFLFGKQSRARAHLPLRLDKIDGLAAFRRPPAIGWLDGEHGDFFAAAPEQIGATLNAFLSGRPLPVALSDAQTAGILRWQSSRLAFWLYRVLHRRRGRPESAPAGAPAEGAPVLGIVVDEADAYSKTFIRNDIEGLFGGRTVVIQTDRRRAVSPIRPVCRIPTGNALRARRILAAVLRPFGHRGPDERLREFCRRHRVTHLLVEFGFVATKAYPAVAPLGLPTTCLFHGADASRWLRRRDYVARLRNILPRLCSIAAVSGHLLRNLEREGLTHARTLVAPCGVDTRRFTPGEKQPGLIAYVGRFTEKKRPDLVIRAFARTAQDRPEARLEMVGDGKLLQACRRLADELGLAGRVVFHGAQKHDFVRVLLRRAPILTLHSMAGADGDEEGMPASAQEGMAAGAVIVSSAHGGMPDHVRDGENGRLFAEGDVEAHAKALTEVLANPGSAATMAASARAYAVRELDLGVIRNRLERLIRGAAQP